MKISTKGRYALRIIVDIAENAKDGYVFTNTHTPEKFNDNGEITHTETS